MDSMPAIQREFVWGPRQDPLNLFDSLARGHPVGSFLFWTCRGEERAADRYVFYGFLTNYHERGSTSKRRTQAPFPGRAKGTTAILDGQQRLTYAEHRAVWEPRSMEGRQGQDR